MPRTFLVEGDEINADIQINRWQSRLSWPPHLHAQIELIYVRRGALTVSIDAQTRVLQQGDFGVAFPNCIHSYAPVEGVEELDVLFYLIKPHLMGDYADTIRAYLPTTPFIERPVLPPDARVALEMLKNQMGGHTDKVRVYAPRTPAAEQPDGALGAPAAWKAAGDEQHAIYLPVFKSYVEIILACTWEQLHPVLSANRNVDLPCRALQYVMQHFQQPITLESTAQALGVTKNHLSRVFSQKLHMRFPQYLHFLRIELAQQLLRNTDKSIITILYECGYESSRTFNRTFQEVCGISPREYRQQYQERQRMENDDIEG